MAKGDALIKFLLFAGRVFYHLKIEGADNIPTQGACVLAFNHVAPIVDGITGLVILQRRRDTISFGGRALPMGGPLGRLLARRKLALKTGRPIALAAEGELEWDGRLQHPLAPGAAWMALRAHVPVVAVVSKGGYDIMPRWAGLPKLTGRVTVRACQPFFVSDGPVTRVTDDLISAASQHIYDEMAALIAR
ncbi:MAG: lysophospholipid acyltransferase family protein [Verrucomicrobia bacterium]|nr:lysophospholipid acyltransferase family protein [Verrucomicrobiota bacterium]